MSGYITKMKNKKRLDDVTKIIDFAHVSGLDLTSTKCELFIIGNEEFGAF